MVQPTNELDTEDQASISSVVSVEPTPDTLSRLVKRLRALTYELVPVEVPTDVITGPLSRLITPQVVKAYIAAAGDLVEALPYCLLRAHKKFMTDAEKNPSDYNENYCRAIACETIAKEVVHVMPRERIPAVLTTRFIHVKHRAIEGGDKTDKANALEMATDLHCTNFLSCREVQDVVNELWKGRLIQKHNETDKDIEFVVYPDETLGRSIWAHMDPTRISVPRYQNIIRIMIWVIFLFVYSRAVREPLETLRPSKAKLDGWELVMYVMALAFALEDIQKIYKLLRFVSWRALGFWNFVSFATDALMVAAFTLRIAGSSSTRGDDARTFKTSSFQILSFVAPLIWMRLIPVFDGYEYIGTMQICVARMLQESGIFFGLLALLGVGFTQGLFALDAADGRREQSEEVVKSLIEALLAAPNYDRWKGWAPGLFLYYLWNVATVLILLNILISLFSTAYDEVAGDAGAEYLAYFANKTVESIRAPDEYTYPAPFNLIEVLLVAPWQYLVSKERYAQINRTVMLGVFFVPLVAIALYEARLDPRKNTWVRAWISEYDQGFFDTPAFRDPEPSPEDASKGLRISVVPFESLVSVFPDTTHSTESIILTETRNLKVQVDEAERRVEQRMEENVRRLEEQIDELKRLLLERRNP